MVRVSLEIESLYEAPVPGEIITWSPGNGKRFSSEKKELLLLARKVQECMEVQDSQVCFLHLFDSRSHSSTLFYQGPDFDIRDLLRLCMDPLCCSVTLIISSSQLCPEIAREKTDLQHSDKNLLVFIFFLKLKWILICFSFVCFN